MLFTLLGSCHTLFFVPATLMARVLLPFFSDQWRVLIQVLDRPESHVGKSSPLQLWTPQFVFRSSCVILLCCYCELFASYITAFEKLRLFHFLLVFWDLQYSEKQLSEKVCGMNGKKYLDSGAGTRGGRGARVWKGAALGIQPQNGGGRGSDTLESAWTAKRSTVSTNSDKPK